MARRKSYCLPSLVLRNGTAVLVGGHRWLGRYPGNAVVLVLRVPPAATLPGPLDIDGDDHDAADCIKEDLFVAPICDFLKSAISKDSLRIHAGFPIRFVSGTRGSTNLGSVPQSLSLNMLNRRNL